MGQYIFGKPWPPMPGIYERLCGWKQSYVDGNPQVVSLVPELSGRVDAIS